MRDESGYMMLTILPFHQQFFFYKHIFSSYDETEVVLWPAVCGDFLRQPSPCTVMVLSSRFRSLKAVTSGTLFSEERARVALDA